MSVMRSRHIVTIGETARSRQHESDVNAAMMEIGQLSFHSIHHSVASHDSVFSGESTHSFNGTAWVCSTLIVYWDDERGQ